MIKVYLSVIHASLTLTDMRGDMLIACIDMSACNFSNLPPQKSCLYSEQLLRAERGTHARQLKSKRCILH